jgi:hypothetical protein
LLQCNKLNHRAHHRVLHKVHLQWDKLHPWWEIQVDQAGIKECLHQDSHRSLRLHRWWIKVDLQWEDHQWVACKVDLLLNLLHLWDLQKVEVLDLVQSWATEADKPQQLTQMSTQLTSLIASDLSFNNSNNMNKTKKYLTTLALRLTSWLIDSLTINWTN